MNDDLNKILHIELSENRDNLADKNFIKNRMNFANKGDSIEGNFKILKNLNLINNNTSSE